MKIEKINENQIRCTISGRELADRKITISELAYGSDKAKELFADMIRQASEEYGFEAEDLPLVVEAIPLNSERIVLVVTKVEDPEELDTRFSKFSPYLRDEEEYGEYDEEDDEEIDESLRMAMDNVSSQVRELLGQIEEKSGGKKPRENDANSSYGKLCRFDSYSEAIRAAHAIDGMYGGESTLYKNPETGELVLTVGPEDITEESYIRTFMTLSEYGRLGTCSLQRERYMMEHFEKIIPEKAVSKLALI